jgi:hypothetical protein
VSLDLGHWGSLGLDCVVREREGGRGVQEDPMVVLLGLDAFPLAL